MNSKQRRILGRVFETPTRSGMEWADIESLFVALGAEISEGRGSRVRVILNDIAAVFHRPHPSRKASKGAVEAARRLLMEAGFKP